MDNEACKKVIEKLLGWVDGGSCGSTPDGDTIGFGITAKQVREAAKELGMDYKEPSDFLSSSKKN